MDEELEKAIDEIPTSPLIMALVGSVSRQLAKEDFELRPGSYDFIRRRGGIIDRFGFNVKVQRMDGYRIEPGIGVRIERVEEIFHQTSCYRPRSHGLTSTMGTSVGVIIGKNSWDCAFALKSDTQIEIVTEQLVNSFRSVALPYFLLWSSLTAIDAELNNEPSKKTIHRAPPYERCSTGIIVAKLVSRANYDQLAAYYLTVMTKNSKGFYLKWFEPLLKYLETVKPEPNLTWREKE